VPICLGGLGIACRNDFDSSRTPPPRGTLGAELFGVMCDRVGAQSLHEDLTGSSYRSVCHPDATGKYADTVDATQLPALVDGQPDINGNPVPIDKQTSDRNYAIARVQAMAKHRTDLIVALDATFPDVSIAVKDVGNANPTQSCGDGGQGRLHDELSTLLGRLQDLYDDGTIPQSTESLGRVVNAFKSAADAQQAWARFDGRAGYRPMDVALGVGRPVIAYPNLRDFTNATLSLLSADSQPYGPNPQYDPNGNRIPVPGAAYAQLTQLLAAAHVELLNSKADQPDPRLVVSADANMGGRTVLSRPRTDLEFLQALLYAQDPAFGGGTSQYIVQRDPRGYAFVGGSAKVPAPFVDSDGDGLADVDANGLFVTSDGKPAPSPFFAIGAPDAIARDTFSRALDATGGNLVYNYIDTSHVYTASLLHDLQPLVDPDPAHQHETLLDLAAGAYVLFGSRDGAARTTKSYSDGEQVAYDAFHVDDSPFVDLLYAAGQILAEPTADQTLAFAKTLIQDHTNDVARLAGDALYAKSLADKDATAKIPPNSVLWDEMIDVAVQISDEPGLLEDLMRALGDDASLPLAGAFATYMANRDRISYDRSNLNGPVVNTTTKTSDLPKTPLDRSKPDTGDNRSEFQRFLQILHDTNGVAACNKDQAVVHGRGIELVQGLPLPPANLDVPYGASNNLLLSPVLLLKYGPNKKSFAECEVFKIDNLAYFYLDSIIGQASLVFRDSFLRNGLTAGNIHLGASNVGVIENSSLIGYDPKNADRYNGPDLSTPGFWDHATDMTFHPKPGWLDRLIGFDVVNDSPGGVGPNGTTNTFLTDLQGNHVGTAVCPERVIPDPCSAPNSSCAGVPDVLPDGMVHGLRSCPDGEWLNQRDPDAIFVAEDKGFLDAITPLVKAFVQAPNPRTGTPRQREDLLVALMDTLSKHWQSTRGTPDECKLTPTTTCSKDGADSYEPLLAQIFASDMFTGLHDFVNILKNVSIPTCAQIDPNTHLCTKPGSMDGIQALANTTYVLINPKHAASMGLKDRKNQSTSLRNDGSLNKQVTPLYLLLQTLNEIDQAFAKYAQANPSDNQRQAQWKRARSQLVDQFFDVAGQNTKTQSFKNQPLTKIAPVLVDMLRAQLLAHCGAASNASSPTPCTWAKTDLWTNASTTIGGPTFATAVGVADVIRQDPGARAELEKLLQYLTSSVSNNDALAALLGTTDDIVQVMRDDANLVPLYHVLAAAMQQTTTDAQGKLQRSVVDATTTFLSRIAGRAYDGTNHEICANELDPNGVLTTSLGKLMTPMPGPNGQPGESPLEVILDAIADVNRASPGGTAKLVGTDYANMASEMSDFLLDGTRGLEQFYAVIRNGTQH
jgi:hypothetical protein